jgi:hypothetical protein
MCFCLFVEPQYVFQAKLQSGRLIVATRRKAEQKALEHNEGQENTI